MKHTDAIQKTKVWLQQYEDNAVYMVNLKDDIHELEAVEYDAQAVQQLKYRLWQLESAKRRIDKAMQLLSEEEKRMLEGRFFWPKKTWKELAVETNKSESSCRRLFYGTMERMAVMLFGANWED